MKSFNKIIALSLVFLTITGFTLSSLSTVTAFAQTDEDVTIELIDVGPNGDMIFDIADEEVVVTEEMQVVVDSEMAKLSKSQLNELVQTVEEDFATPSGLPAFLASIVAAISLKTKLGFLWVAQTCALKPTLCSLVLKAIIHSPKAIDCARTSINQRRFAC